MNKEINKVYLKTIIFLQISILLTNCNLNNINVFFSKEFCITKIETNQNNLTENKFIEIIVEFSEQADKSSIEKAFSLSNSTNSIYGIFTWESDKKLHFISTNKFCIKDEFTLTINKNAHDVFGNSLSSDYKQIISSRDDNSIPKIILYSPQKYSYTENLFSDIVVTFSSSMNPYSVINCFTIEPDCSFIYSWNESHTIFTFKPIEPYNPSQIYNVKIEQDAISENNIKIEQETSWSFYINSDKTAPVINQIDNNDKSNFIILSNSTPSNKIINNKIEKDTELCLNFSESIDTDSFFGSIEFIPTCNYKVTWKNNNTQAIISFEEELQNNTNYYFSLNKNIKDSNGNYIDYGLEKTRIYYFITNGNNSFCPYLESISLEIPEYNSEYSNGQNQIIFDKSSEKEIVNETLNFSYHEQENKSLDFIISTISYTFVSGQDSIIDYFSFVEGFSVLSKDNAISFIPEKIDLLTNIEERDNNLVTINKFLVHGKIKDSNTNSSFVNFILHDSIKDNHNNRLNKAYLFQVLDKDNN